MKGQQFAKNILYLLRPFRRQVVLVTVFVVVYELVKIGPPYLLKIVVDHLVHWDPAKIPDMLWLIGGMLLVDIAILIAHWGIDKYIFWLLIGIEEVLPMQLHRKLLSLSLGYHEQQSTGSLIVKIQSGVDRLVTFTSSMSWDFMPSVIQLVVTAVAIAWLNWQLGLVFVGVVPLFLWLTWRMGVHLYPYRKKRHQGYEDAGGIMAESIINIYTVQSFSQEPAELGRHQRVREQISEGSRYEFGTRLTHNFWRGFLVDCGRVAVLAYGVFLVWRNAISIGDLIFFTTLSEKAYLSLFRLSRVYDHLVESGTAVERLMGVLQQPALVTSPRGGKKPRRIRGAITFDHVSFSYPGALHVPVLQDVSFTIQPGQRVALVGPSGGGKTTIVKLLYRHYDVTGGSILIDGLDVRRYDLTPYRQQLAIVPQDVEIFNTTARENIAYGRRKASERAIVRAAGVAHADEFIRQLPDGYQTVVGERGVRLSGGQKQRLGIARAVLADPRILIFDEATSHLDTLSERLIQESLETLAQDRTTIIIAHRLSTIQSADLILVVEDGRIKEAGSHADLRQGSGLYAQLLALQGLGQLRS